MLTFQQSVGGEGRPSCGLSTIAFPFGSQSSFECRIVSDLEYDRRKQVDRHLSNGTELTDFDVTFSLFFDSLPASPLIRDSLPTEFSLEKKKTRFPSVRRDEDRFDWLVTWDTRRYHRDLWKQIRTGRMSQHRRSKLVSFRFHRSLVVLGRVYSNERSLGNRNDWINRRSQIVRCSFHRFDRWTSSIQPPIARGDSTVVTLDRYKQISIHRCPSLTSWLVWGSVRRLLRWFVCYRTRWCWPRRPSRDSCTLRWINYWHWSPRDGFVEV